jgi:TonB family protein
MANELSGLILACMLSTANPAWSQSAEPPLRPFLMDAAQVARAEAALKADIAARPQQINTYIQLAELYRMDNRHDEAEAVLRSALQIAPRTEAVYSSLVSLYSPVYEPERVLEVAQEWATAIPTSIRALVLQAIAHMERAKRVRRSRAEASGHLDLAARALASAKEIDADDRGVASAYANVLRLKADFETDPAERARLRAEADDLAQRAGLRTPRGQLPMTSSPPASPSAPTAPPASPSDGLPRANGGPVRVGSTIAPPMKVRDVPPQYPPDAREARVQGVVILETTISEAGQVTEARVLRSIPMLDQAAIDAVRQWEFQPTVLNGRAVPVIMVVTVQFSLQ